MMVMIKLSATLLLALHQFAAAQEIKFDFGGLHPTATVDGQEVDASNNHHHHRDLQETGCQLQGPYLVCNYAYQIQGQVLDEVTGDAYPVATDIAFRAQCDGNSNVGFDYRQGTNCGCQAHVTKTDLNSNTVVSRQICPCQVCAAELGDNPIHVDCTEAAAAAAAADDAVADSVTVDGGAVQVFETDTNFIIQSCSSLDCYGYCNSTCSLNCNDEDLEPCEFCVADGTEFEIPDNGQESKDIGNFGSEDGDSGAAETAAAIASTVIMGAGLALLWV